MIVVFHWLVVLVFMFYSAFTVDSQPEDTIITGAEQTDKWLPLVEDKTVGVVVNQTSRIGDQHLIDVMLANDVSVRSIFAPEHGYRGNFDAGELIVDGRDAKTGIPVISLYGDNKKPTREHLSGIDVVVFDIQDVGVRFFTYISTMHYVMEACAENDVPFVVLDRPNPNGDYVDGPVLKPEFNSFVGMHPIPVVHGLTVGELALMINGEEWLKEGEECCLTVVEMDNYTHSKAYSLPIKPSPNLPNDLSVRLYPSLCFFEATIISVGRGTYYPFQVAGAPDTDFGDFIFIPESITGMAKNPKYEGKVCYGKDYRGLKVEEQFFSLKPFFDFYETSGRDPDFVSRRQWFNLLAGTDQLLKQIEKGLSEEEIRLSWEEELADYRQLRAKYLLYPL